MNTDKTGAEVFKGVMLAHLILGLHVVVIVVIGLVVIFFGGIARYWVWILLGGLCLAALGGYGLYRRMKTRGRDLFRDVRGASVPPGATLEVSFLGGLASVKFGRPGQPPSELETPRGPALLEDPASMRVRELAYLAQMFEKDLITRQEFERAKAAILNPPAGQGSGPATVEN
jgi:hypothetical protein